MSVSDLDVGQVYTGNGSTTVFPINFDFSDDDQVHVYAIVIATGVIEEKVVSTHYTISGGNVTMLVAPPSTRKLVVERVTVPEQAIDFLADTAPFSEILERGLDYLTWLVQEVYAKVNRSVKFGPDANLTGKNINLPYDLFDTPLATITVNATGDGFAIGPTVDQISGAADAAAAALASQTAAAASQAAAATALAAATAAQTAAAASASSAASAAASAAAFAYTILGTGASPVTVVNGTGFRDSSNNFDNAAGRQTIFFAGENAGINEIAANPAIENHTVLGAEVSLVLESSGNLLRLSPSATIQINGIWEAFNRGDSITLVWNGTLYRERSRSN